jgi:hypothetical protein
LSDVYFSTFSGDISGNMNLTPLPTIWMRLTLKSKSFWESPYVKNAKVDSTDVAIDDSGKSKISFQLVFVA